MNKKHFDWDKHLSDAKYTEIKNNSPLLERIRPPTMYSPDHKWLYLSSQDVDIETNDLINLKNFFKCLSICYLSAKERNEYLKLGIIRIDFIEVCRLIQVLVENPEDYGDPDFIIAGWKE